MGSWFPYFCSLSLSEASEVKVQIVSDSIAKYVEGIRQTEVISFPGININQLAYKIDKEHLVLDKKVVILHVGTNNIEKMETGAILSAFNNLISSIRRRSDPMIVISSILPRPKDHSSHGDRVKNVNKGLVQLSKDRKMRLLHTYRSFLKYCLPKREMFAINDQSLHLNTEGTRRLRQFFINSVAHLLKEV